MVQLYVLRSSDVPWGDYGTVLTHGMGQVDSGGLFQLERTGPFIPPITFPGFRIVVTDRLRERIEQQSFTGCQFREIVKRRIVRLDWHLWDRGASEPQKHPAEGEPENFVLGRKHSPETASALGTLWELAVDEIPGLQVEGGKAVNLARYRGQDICRASVWGYVYVAERFKLWLEAEVGDWVAFVGAPVVGVA